MRADDVMGSEKSFRGHHTATAYNPSNIQTSLQPARSMTKLRTPGPHKYFGSHYIGPIFDINNIESKLQDAQLKYHAASTEEKNAGIEIEYDGQIVDWQKESIVFPFLPKKFIKSFTPKSGVFLSKQVPLLLVAETRSQDEDDEEENDHQGEIIKILFKYGDDLR
jgi:hypothetical protein